MTQNVPAGRGSVGGRPARAGHAAQPAGTDAQYLPPLLGLMTVVDHLRDFRLGGGSVSGLLHRNRAGDRDLATSRPGHEPGRQGQDARRAGGQGRLDRIAAQRPSGHSLGDGPVAVALHSRQRAGRHRVIDGVRREVHRAGATCPTLGAAATRWPDAAGPARHGRNQHGVPAIGVGSGPDRPAEAQRVTGCAGTSVQWAGRTAWPIAERLGFVSGQAGAEPSRIQA